MVKWLFRLTLIFGLLSLTLFLISSIKISSSNIETLIISDLVAYQGGSESIAHRYYNSDDDQILLNEFDEIPLNVEVYRNDTLRYWNRASASTTYITGNNYLLTTIGDSLVFIRIKLNISAFNKLVSNSVYRLSPIISDSFISIDGHKIGYQLIQTTRFPGLKIGGWMALLGSFLFFCLYWCTLIKKEKEKNRTVTITTILYVTFWLVLLLLHHDETFNGFMQEFNLTRVTSSSSLFNKSPGMFIINLIFLSGIVYNLPAFINNIKSRISKYPQVIALLAGFLIFTSFAAGSTIIESFVLSPEINLEIESLLRFNTTSFVLILGFVIMMLLIFHTSQVIYEWLNSHPMSIGSKLLYTMIGWALGYLVLYLNGSFNIPLWIFSLFIAAYSLILDAYTENNDKKITYLIWWMIMFSAYLAIVLFYFGLKKDIAERTEFLNNHYQLSDTEIVSLMTSIQDSLTQRDIFNRIATLENNARLDRQDLKQFIFENIPELQNDSLIFNIELFDKTSGTTLFVNHFADFYQINQSYINSQKVGHQVFHNPFEDIYYSRFEIIRSFPANASWYLFITIEKKIIKNQHLYHNQNFGYAVFSRDRIIEKVDNFLTSPNLSLLASTTENSIFDGYSLVVSKPSDQYKIVSWKKVSGLIKPISLFSFIFTLSGILLLILTLVNTKFEFLPDNLNLKFGSRASLKTKIQLSVILLILVTFFIIGSITGIYFKNIIQANQNSKIREETVSIVNNIRSDIQNLAGDEYATGYLGSKLNDLSFIHDKDLSLYDADGRIVASTSKSDINIYIPFDLWYNQINSKDNHPIEIRSEDGHEIIPLYLSKNTPFGFLKIEYHTHDHSADTILDFLSTILNAYIFLFLIAGAIAITIANSITQPLTRLADKLKKFKLGKTNERLDWNSNDEIGTLISEYNNLTGELEKSVGLLAKTERDMAWREMAKQVAHEIKNPLTPMKLNIQYLQKTSKENPERAFEMIPKVSASLIEQIDNLSQIAGEFSNFANLPQASNEKIILNEIVETVHDFFRKRDDMDIHLNEPIDELYVFADKNHLVRVLNNLLKNAIQAIPEDRRGRIEIELTKEENEAVIKISDNGTGISDDMKDKVFTPNFTTKSSGTGLGLAISSNIVDAFNGHLYFKTKEGEGTDFYLRLPLMRREDDYSGQTRVTLD